MGGLPCAKQILDQIRALEQAMGCMANTIVLYHDTTQPTQDQADAFQDACNEVALVAGKIQKYVAGSGGG